MFKQQERAESDYSITAWENFTYGRDEYPDQRNTKISVLVGIIVLAGTFELVGTFVPTGI